MQDQDIENLRIPPHSNEAEQSILGGLLLNNEAWDTVSDLISEEDFYRYDHRLIFQSMVRLFNVNRPMDVVTLAEDLDKNAKLDEIGGLAYLSQLAKDTPTAANIKRYAEIVRERSVLRQLVQVGTDIANSAYQPDGQEVSELLNTAEEKMYQIAEQGSRGKKHFTSMKELLEGVVDRIDELYQQDNPITGIPTGFKDFDMKTSGLQNGDLVIVAGRPSMGKCIVSGSRLVDPLTGALNSIDEIVSNKSGMVTCVNNQFKLEKKLISQFVDDGVKPVFKVKTELGKTIETTMTHPFLTGLGWQKLQDIQVGEVIAVPRSMPIFGQTTLPEHQIKALAYFITDGGVTQACPIFTNINSEIVGDFTKAMEAFGDIEVNRVAWDDRAPSYRVSSARYSSQIWTARFSNVLQETLQQLQFSGKHLAAQVGCAPSTVSQWVNARALPNPKGYSSLCDVLGISFRESTYEAFSQGSSLHNPVTEWLKNCGLWGTHAPQKKLPESVFQYTKSSLKLLLNRMFACDGGVSIFKTGQVRMSYGTASFELAEQVQHLLLRFGILAKLRKKTHHKNIQFEVEIVNTQGILTFIDEIGMLGKQTRLDEAKSLLMSKRDHSNLDSLPPSVCDYVLTLKEQSGMSWKDLYKAKGLQCPAGFNAHLSGQSRRLLSRDKAAFYAKLFDDTYLNSLAHSDVYWDEIVSIEFTGEKQVYDLTVPDLHNFIAEDIFVHNTTFSMNVAEAAAINEGVPVAVFSLEMPGEQLAMRMLSSMGRINASRMRTGKLEDEDWPKLTNAVGRMADAPIFIDDSSGMSPTEIRARARRLKREHGLGLVVIDYLQLMRGSGRGGENRTTEISEISRSLKAMARELNVPVIALSQLNRSLEQRPNKRPIMSDLRESGAIEQDADVIVFVYRDEVYNEESSDKGTAEIIIGKQRNGPIGMVRLAFLGEYTRFENFAGIADEYDH